MDRATAAPIVRRGRVAASIAITVAIAAITNGALAIFGLNQPASQHWPAFAPRGPVIGLVWIGLFAAMGAAFALARSKGAVATLVAICLAFPFYTHAVGGHAIELIGNLVTLAYALWLIVRLRSESSAAALFVGFVAAWLIFATALVLGLVQLNGWSTPR